MCFTHHSKVKYYQSYLQNLQLFVNLPSSTIIPNIKTDCWICTSILHNHAKYTSIGFSLPSCRIMPHIMTAHLNWSSMCQSDTKYHKHLGTSADTRSQTTVSLHLLQQMKGPCLSGMIESDFGLMEYGIKEKPRKVSWLLFRHCMTGIKSNPLGSKLLLTSLFHWSTCI